MKFLRIGTKSQSTKVLPLRNANENKQNIDPCPMQKPLTKGMNVLCDKSTINTEMEHENIFQVEKETQRQEQVYEKEILEFLLSQVRPAPMNYNYFDKQPDITEHMRVVLFNWLIDVHLKYKLHPQTFFITINIIDHFLSTQAVHRTELQLVGITALWIAAKYQETYQVPKLSNLVYICDSTYTDVQILSMESKILSQIQFDFLRTTSFGYFEVIKRYTVLNEKDQFLARYLLEGILFDVGSRKYTDLTIAASVIFFIQKLRRYDLKKQQKMNEITGVSQKQLRACARQICSMWQRFHEVNQLSSLRQKFMRPEFMEVAKIRLSQKGDKLPTK